MVSVKLVAAELGADGFDAVLLPSVESRESLSQPG